MHISLFYCVQVFFIYSLFFVCPQRTMFASFASLFFFCCWGSVVVVDMHDVVHKCFSLCKFCIFNSGMSFEMKQWHKGIINSVKKTQHCFALQRRRNVREREQRQRLQNLWVTRWNIMNEYFQQLKCKKEGLCVYAVLRVKFIYCYMASRVKPPFFTYERRTMPQNCAIFLVLNS